MWKLPKNWWKSATCILMSLNGALPAAWKIGLPGACIQSENVRPELFVNGNLIWPLQVKWRTWVMRPTLNKGHTNQKGEICIPFRSLIRNILATLYQVSAQWGDEWAAGSTCCGSVGLWQRKRFLATASQHIKLLALKASFVFFPKWSQKGFSEWGSLVGPGVYDLAWSSSPLVLMCACADGAVRLYHVQPEVTEIAQNQLSDCILTHLCWGAGEARCEFSMSVLNRFKMHVQRV